MWFERSKSPAQLMIFLILVAAFARGVFISSAQSNENSSSDSYQVCKSQWGNYVSKFKQLYEDKNIRFIFLDSEGRAYNCLKIPINPMDWEEMELVYLDITRLAAKAEKGGGAKGTIDCAVWRNTLFGEVIFDVYLPSKDNVEKCHKYLSKYIKNNF